jgi:hypothetical protein
MRILITFTDGDTCDGDYVGDTAGPLLGSLYLTTVAINGSTTAGPPGPRLETVEGKLAIDSGHGSNDKNQWTTDESWTFRLDGPAYFEGLSLGSFNNNSAPGEVFVISSTSFSGLGTVTTGPGVTYSDSSGVGSFTLSNHPNGILGLADIGGTPLLVEANTDIHLEYTSGNEMFLQSMSFSAVPEPSCLGLLSVGGLWAARRRQRSVKQLC